MKILPVSNYQTQNQNSKRQNVNFGSLDIRGQHADEIIEFIEQVKGIKLMSARNACPNTHSNSTIHMLLEDFDHALTFLKLKRSEIVKSAETNSTNRVIYSIDDIEDTPAEKIKQWASISFQNTRVF